MWSDNETDRDFLNFKYVADIAAEMIVQANGTPISMGIAGSWGMGKSSLMQLLARALQQQGSDKFIFVSFNAWLYQGYDDTRAALIEVIAREILAHVQQSEGLTDVVKKKAVSLLKRVNWFRVVGATITTGAALALGIPPIGLAGEAVSAIKALSDGTVSAEDLKATVDTTEKIASSAAGAVGPKEERATPPKAIQEFRDELEATLKELRVTLVVLIDDLDRCLPTTSIATLEAMRLFLFLRQTAFVIAADDKMIRQAVKTHFGDIQLDDDLVTNYFDKLIQVPVRVPPLGTQEVRAYLMLLYIENSTLDAGVREALRANICGRLGTTWKGHRVDREYVGSLIPNCPSDLAQKLDIADRLAPIMTSAQKIAGNPRLIKRFLNTLSIRLAIAAKLEITVDEAALTKLLLFERCAGDVAYAQLLAQINDSPDGRPVKLLEYETLAKNSPEKLTLEKDWDTPFVKEWLLLSPPLGDIDLRGIAYVSREHLPIITSPDSLSHEATEILNALLVQLSAPSPILTAKIKAIPSHEASLIADRLFISARSVSEWGVPPILNSMITVAEGNQDAAKKVGNFLERISPKQLAPAIIPLLKDKAWAKGALAIWQKHKETPPPVKRAIEIK